MSYPAGIPDWFRALVGTAIAIGIAAAVVAFLTWVTR
jgi:hypothetical protein